MMAAMTGEIPMNTETTTERQNVLAAVISTLVFLAVLLLVAYRISRAKSEAHHAEIEAPQLNEVTELELA
jgi:hypothetical protein